MTSLIYTHYGYAHTECLSPVTPEQVTKVCVWNIWCFLLHMCTGMNNRLQFTNNIRMFLEVNVN